MLRKRLHPLLVLMPVVISLFLAQASTVLSAEEMTNESSNAYRTYEVKKGDTLWGISKKFIEDPYYWPDLWANNPEIQNPHIILPGQKLRIYAGPIVVVGVEPPPPVQEAATPETPVVLPPAEPIVEAEPQITINVPAGLSFISESKQISAGKIFDFTDARHFAIIGETVFVRVPANTVVNVGDLLEILVSKGEVIHPVTKKRLGFQVDQLGILEITALGTDLHTAIIRKSLREVERGAWLSPLGAIRQQIDLRRAEKDLTGIVVSASSGKEMQGPNDPLFIDLGEKQGLKAGNLLTITRSRQATDLAEIKNKKDASLVFPEELVGYALVVETDPGTSTAVVLKSLGPIMVGDRVRTQTGPITR